MAKKILGIVGSYRKSGTIDSLVSEVLSAAQERGAETEKIYLTDRQIEFCTNCRRCTQAPGCEPGKCIHNDDVADILARCGKADGIVIGAPVNFYNVNAVTRKFMERLTCLAYWPWGQPAPKWRSKVRNKQAVLITSTAMPAIFGRVLTGALRALKITAQCLGAKPVATIFVGMIAQQEHAPAPSRAIRKARDAGAKLASP
jgi:multimeric flavodoxin WrbA